MQLINLKHIAATNHTFPIKTASLASTSTGFQFFISWQLPLSTPISPIIRLYLCHQHALSTVTLTNSNTETCMYSYTPTHTEDLHAFRQTQTCALLNPFTKHLHALSPTLTSTKQTYSNTYICSHTHTFSK